MPDFSHPEVVKAVERAIIEIKGEKIVQGSDSYYPNPKQRPHLHWNKKYMGINSSPITNDGWFLGRKTIKHIIDK